MRAALSQALRDRRQQIGASTTRLAALTGLSFHTVIAYEQRRRLPSLTTLATVVAALDTTVVELLQGVEPFDAPADGSPREVLHSPTAQTTGTTASAASAASAAVVSVGSAIRGRRKALGITLAELAVATDLSPFTIQSYELDRRLPALEALALVAAALDATIVELLRGVAPFETP